MRMTMVKGEPTQQNDKLPKLKNETTIETEPAIEELAIKHPLANKWTLRFYENKSKVWEENIHEVASFDTAEDFWCLFNHLKPPSELSLQSDYSFFKNGIKPMWEDNRNKSGGGWLIQLPPAKSSPSIVNEAWKNIVLSIIGEVYEHSNEINGAIVNVRNKGTKVSVWTSNAENESNIMSIGRKIREILGTNPQMNYETHVNAANKQGYSLN